MSLSDGPRMKLGSYLEFLGDGDPMDPVQQWLDAGNRSLKIEEPGSAHLIYAATRLKKFSNSYLVGRNIPMMEDIMQGIPPSAAAADFWWRSVKHYVGSIPQNVHWEDGYNELGAFEDPAVRAGFIAYELRRGQLMNAAGYHCCYLNVSAETVPLVLQHIAEFLPLFEQAYLNDDLIGLHAYWSPHFYDRVSGQMESIAEPFLFPHRQLVREMKRRGISHIPWFFYTEGPSIDTNLQYNRHYDGFLTVMDRATMTEEIQWAEVQVHTDPYLVGGAGYIWERGEQLDKVMYNESTRQPAHGKDNPEQPSVFEHRLEMSKGFNPGVYRAPVAGAIPVPVPNPEPPPPATGPGKAKTAPAGIRYNLRLTPEAKADNSNLLFPELPYSYPVTVTGKTARSSSGLQYSEVMASVVLDEDAGVLPTKGWLLTSGLIRA